MERTSVDNLDRLADRFSRHPELAVRFREYWRESLGQVAVLEACLKKLGSDTSTFRDLARRFVGIAQAYAGAIRSMSRSRIAWPRTRPYTFRSRHTFRCAQRLWSLAQPEIARMCDENLERERAMAGWLEQQITEVTLEFLRP